MDVFTSGDLILAVNPHNKKGGLSRKGQLVQLTPIETRLLLYFWRHSGRTLSYRKILYDVWGCHYVRSNLTVCVFNLRKKLHRFNADNSLLTIREVGYRYSPPK